jgi:hypothetical protein
MTTTAENEVAREFCYQLAMVLRRLNGKSEEISAEGLPETIGDRVYDENNEVGQLFADQIVVAL